VRRPERGSRTIEEVTRVFTGIVEELGRVVEVTKLADDSARLVVSGPLVTTDAKHGDSIAVNGVCLTVVTLTEGTFSADVMAETLHRSSLGALQAGDPVNLERPMAADGRFGGHIVQGHVDGLGRIRARHPSDNWEVVEVDLPEDLARFLVEKGSITVDGVSLTVVEVVDGDEPWFAVSLIPTTLTATTLGSRQVGDPVNLEVDVIAKYVERMVGVRS
jgi:riboflavin synthase